MAAPKKNNFWQFRDKHGPNFSYDKGTLWKEFVAYAEWMQNRVWNKKEAVKSGTKAGKLIDIPTQAPMSIEGFCIFADISFQTFLNYESNKDPWKDLFEVTSRIRSIIEVVQFEGATVNAFNPNIIARKLGLADKQDVVVHNEQPLFPEDTD